MYYDIWQILEKRLNFSTILTKLEDGKKKGWDALIQTVAYKKYDLFLAGNSLTESRAKIVDHSFPIIQTSVRLIYLRHYNLAADSSRWVYTQSFMPGSWIAIVLVTLGLFATYVVLQHIANQVKKNTYFSIQDQAC